MPKRPPRKPPTSTDMRRIAQDALDGIDHDPTRITSGDWFPSPRCQDAPLAKARPRLRLIRGGKK